MEKYLTFLIYGKKVGVKYSPEYKLKKTLINKVYKDDNGFEYIDFQHNKIRVYDTGDFLYNEPLKKFDGLLFIQYNDDQIALKTEGFFKDSDNVKFEIKPSEILSEVSV